MKKFTSAAVVAAALAFTGCDMLADEKAEAGIEQTAQKNITLSIPVDPSSQFAQVAKSAVVKVYDADNKLVSETVLTISETAVTGEVKNIPVGEYTFIIEVSNAEGTVVYTGEADTAISASTTTEVDIEIAPVTGNAIINGTIKEDTPIIGDTLVLGTPKETKDATIIGGIDSVSTYEDLTYGRHTIMEIGEYDNNTKFRYLVQYPTTDLTGKTIKAASISMKSIGWREKHNNLPVTIDVHALLKPWNAGTCKTVSNTDLAYHGEKNSEIVNGTSANESAFGVAWNKHMIGTDDVDATAKSFANDTYEIADGNNLLWQFDVTELVQAWVDGTIENNGIVMKIRDENRAKYDKKSFPRFRTWDHESPVGYAPTLTVIYE